MKKTTSVLLSASLLLALTMVGHSWAAVCPPRVLTRLGKALKADADAVIDYWKRVPSGSEVERGLVVAFEKLDDLAAHRVNGILQVFPQPEVHFERIARLKEVPGLDKEIADLGRGLENVNNAKGAAAELRYATDVLSPSEIARFQPEIPGGVPDILDGAGNLHEIKYREWTLPEFLVRRDLEDILTQATNAQQFAAANGKVYTLAFEIPPPPIYKAVFDEIFAEFRSRPGVVIVEGF
jgi:hypothetical protein